VDLDQGADRLLGSHLRPARPTDSNVSRNRLLLVRGQLAVDKRRDEIIQARTVRH
jgi:hypothetical protein